MNVRRRPGLQALWALCAVAVLLCAATTAAAQEPGPPPPPKEEPAAPPEEPEPDVPQPDLERAGLGAREQAQPGRRAPTLVAIVVEGQRRYTQAQIIAALGAKVGEPYDPAVVEKGLDTLWRAFHAKARVDLREAAGGVEMRVVVDEMNVDLEPRFVGYSEIDLDDLKRWALLEDRGELYLYQAERVRQRLLEGYRREGFYFVEVDVVRRGTDIGVDPEGALPDVIFEIREGPRVQVQDVLVTGNDSMPETGMWWWKGGLKKLAKVELGGPWLFDWNGEEFVTEKLDADLLAMREVYRDRGWLDAVVEIDRLEFSADRSEVTIHVIVDEGRPYTVESLEIEAVERTWNQQRQDYDEASADFVIPREELLALCRLKPGRRYERFVQEADAAAIRDRYGREGYVAHPSLRLDGFEFLEPRLVFDPVNQRVAVTYRIAQGKQRWIREVLMTGTTHTRDRVVRREVDVLPGDVADLTKIRRALGRIYSTGYFNDEMRPLEHRDPTFTFRTTPDPNWVDLEYQVQEGTVVNFQVQGGVDSNSGLFGRISLTMRNADLAAPPESLWSTFGDIYDKSAFHGAGQRIDLEYMPGTVENSYRIRFLEPDLFRKHFDRWSIEFELNRWERSQRFYDEERFERRIRLGREFGREFALFMGYRFTDVEVDDLDQGEAAPVPPNETGFPPSIYQQLGGQKLIAGPTLDLNYRKLDTLFAPREGLQVIWRNGVYGSAFGGDFDYWSADMDLDWFFLTPGVEGEVRPGFHIGLGLAVADAYGDTEEVPYTERFFLGGSRLLRGFAFRGVGPNLGSNPLGGQSSFDTTLEYRIPLYKNVQPGTYKEIEMFRLTLFGDAGILDPEAFRLDPDELRASLGFSLGMISPFPVMLNFGFPILEGEGDRKQVFSFSIFQLAF
ncbi:MAG: BamA/TamA family outer membrane protein [Planctomycetes bacterium]|nr:BamA/TamA family outer membrane protein [Planctomycetota bacterium]